MVNDFGTFHKDFNTISTPAFAGYETRCRKTSTIVQITSRETQAVNKTSFFWRSEIIDFQSRSEAVSHLRGHKNYRSLAGRWRKRELQTDMQCPADSSRFWQAHSFKRIRTTKQYSFEW